MQKICTKIPYRREIVRTKTKVLYSLMTSMTMFTPNQNPSNFVRIQLITKLDRYSLGVSYIWTDFGLDF